MKNTDNSTAIAFIDDVIEYFENMPTLTEEEEALLESARWTKDELESDKEG